MTRSCDQCGAVHDDGADCESCFHALLAYENERPAAFGAVHLLTVATYYLQHPAGYTHEALAHWRELIAKSLDGASVRQLRELSGKRFAGSKRVRARRNGGAELVAPRLAGYHPGGVHAGHRRGRRHVCRSGPRVGG